MAGDTVTDPATTVTVVVAAVLVPPGPEHVNEKAVVVVSAPEADEPLVATAPCHPPEAVQPDALVELHVRVEIPPLGTTEGFAVNVAVGTAGKTVTCAVAGALVPPAPVHVSEYDVVAVKAPVLRVPLAARSPCHPPEPVQAVASVELHVKVEAPPLATAAGLAVNVATGAGGGAGGATVTCAVAAALVPPAPVHVSEYDVVAVKAPVFRVPLAARVPCHPPEAMQSVAFVELQDNVTELPASMAAEDAARDAVGTGAEGVAVTPPDDPPPHADRIGSRIQASQRIRRAEFKQPGSNPVGRIEFGVAHDGIETYLSTLAPLILRNAPHPNFARRNTARNVGR